MLHKLGNTIFKRLFLPFLAIIFLQGVVFLVVFFQGGTVQQAEDNSFTVLNEQVLNRQRYIETEMTARWASLVEFETLLLGDIRQALAISDASASDIAADSALTTQILRGSMENLLYTLRKSNVTGAFLVLDGPAFADIPTEASRAGLYIRDLDPSGSYSATNDDLLCERGPAEIAQAFSIPLNTNWEGSFRFSGPGEAEGERYFFNPLEAYRSGDYESDDSADFGYWAYSHRLNERDVEVISYSIPLLLDGEAIGVLGIDITTAHLQTFLPYDELDASRNGVYYMGIREEGAETLRTVVTSGPLYRAYFGNAPTISFEETDRSHVLLLETGDDDMGFFGNAQSLHLYNSNTPFEGDQWLIMGMMRETDLLGHARALSRMIYLSTLISLGIGMVGLLLTSNLITRPISRLARALRSTNPNKPIRLDRIHIQEIDLLSESIESLSQAVAENASKLSKTMEMMNLPIGIFEINPATEQVFCSQKFLEYTGAESIGHDTYIPIERFNRLLKDLKQYLINEKDGIYLLPYENDVLWLRLLRMQYGDLELGALSDITKEMKEKQKIEYERDYDVLTALYNRRAFHHHVETLFAHREYLGMAALIMWDIDNLKYVNDTYGHTVGDGYICAFAQILSIFNTSHSITARRSGDEFYAFLYGYSCREEIEEQINQAWMQLQNADWELPDGGTIRIRVSAGVAWYPKDAETLEELIKYADFAMYNVKHTTKGRMKDFDMETYQQNSVLINGTEALNQLIEKKLLHYAMQPIFSAHDGSIYGYEMLMRSDMRELPGVDEVLKLAKAQSKLDDIEDLTFFLGMEAFVDYLRRDEIAPGVKVFLNSIGGQILSSARLRDFEAMFGAQLSNIVIELTESQPATEANVRKKIDIISRWKAQIALDDYGTGYSNESSLLRFAPQIIKIDISIIADIDSNPDQQEVVENLISYTRPRGIHVLAEGVETEAEMRYLLLHGVDYMQGYYLAHPSNRPNDYNEKAVALFRRLIGERDAL